MAKRRSTVEILQAARGRIENEKNWTTGRLYGYRYRPNGYSSAVARPEEANCFCAVGACAAEFALASDVVDDANGLVNMSEAPLTRVVRYLNAAAEQLSRGRDLRAYQWNDSAKHPDVLAMFDLAIRNAKRRHVNGKRYASQ